MVLIWTLTGCLLDIRLLRAKSIAAAEEFECSGRCRGLGLVLTVEERKRLGL